MAKKIVSKKKEQFDFQALNNNKAITSVLIFVIFIMSFIILWQLLTIR